MFSWLKTKEKGACEICGKDLSQVHAFKKVFTAFKILDKQVLKNLSPIQMSNQAYISSLIKIRSIMSVASITGQSNGDLFNYDVELKSQPHDFCSTKCAYESATKNKLLFIFNDVENKCQKRILCPDTKTINEQLQNSSAPYRGLFVHKSVADHYAPSVAMTTQNLVLRDLEVADLAGLWDIYQDHDTMALFDPDMAKQNLDKDGFYKAITKQFIETNSYYWVICPNTAFNSVLGFCYVVDKGQGVHVEFAINKLARGRGIMTEALAALLKYLQSQGIREIKAVSELHNAGSKKVLTKLGFRSIQAPVLSGSGGVSMKLVYNLQI